MVPGTCREGDDGGRTKPLINLNLVGLGGGIQEFLIEDAQGVAPNPTGDALGCVPSTPHPSASLPMHALISILQRVFQHFRQSCRRTLPRAGWRLRAHTGGDILRNIVIFDNFRGAKVRIISETTKFFSNFLIKKFRNLICCTQIRKFNILICCTLIKLDIFNRIFLAVSEILRNFAPK